MATPHGGGLRFGACQITLTRQKIVCNQVLYHLRSRGIENALIAYCESQNITVVGYSPFGQGDFPKASSRQGKVLDTLAFCSLRMLLALRVTPV